MIKPRQIITRTPLFLRVVSLYFVAWLMFIIIGFGGGLNTAKITQPIVQRTSPIVSMAVVDGYPKSFSMKRLGIDLPVRTGVYTKESDSWSLSDDAVYFAPMSSLPNNQRGTTFIYGHNNDNVLAQLSEGIVPGDRVSIVTANGHEFIYEYDKYTLVEPKSTGVLYEKSPTIPKLIVMTCEGIWSQSRKLMYFNLVEAK